MGKSLAAHAIGGAIAAFAFVLGMESPLLAQESAATPTVMYPDTSAVSKPLWAAPKSESVFAPDEDLNQKPLHPLPQRHSNAQPNASDRALQTKAGAHFKVQPKTGFGGIVQDGSIPPDPNIAVGPDRIVQLVNAEIAVFEKDGTVLPGYPKNLSSLWSNLGGGCGSKDAGDPIVQYDTLADRWVITQLGSLRSPFAECFAVSQTSDPTGAYNVYVYNFGRNLNDYPKFGVWPTATNSAYFGTYNLFANGSNFIGADLCAYDREAMLAGAAAPASVCFQISGDAGFLPADLDGKTPPTDGSPGYFLNFDTTSSSLRLYKMTPDFANPSNTKLSSPTDLPVAAFQMACDGGTCIPQPGTNRQLDSLGDRLMYRLAYRNFGDHESMVVNHSVTAGSSVGVRWYDLEATSPGAFSVAQQGTFAPDSDYRWMGSIAMDSAGDMALGYSRSSGSTYPGIYLTGRTPSDPAGTMEAEIELQAGGGSQTGYTRWGDYTSMRIDPSDDCTFWYTNEYYPQTASYNWFTQIGSFKFPGCGGAASSPDFSLAESPSPIAITAGSGSSGTVTVTAIAGFASTVNLAASCPTGVSASVTPTAVTPTASALLQVSAAADAAAGPYMCTVTGTDAADATVQHATTFEVDVSAPVSDFSLSASPSSLPIRRGSSGSATIAIAGSASVSLSVSGVPSRTSASFSPNPAQGSSTLTVKVNRRASPGQYTLTVTGTDGTHTHTASLSLTIQ